MTKSLLIVNFNELAFFAAKGQEKKTFFSNKEKKKPFS
jgi:hypothetical protein